MSHNHGNVFEVLFSVSKDPHYKLIRNAIYWSVVIASIITILKLSAWLFTNSTSIQAAFVDSLMDVISSITAVFAILIAQRPADEHHRFGHSKAESVATLGQTMFVLVSGILLLTEVIEHAFNHEQIKEAEAGIWLIILSSVLLACLILIQRYTIKRTKSLLIEAVAVHYKGDLVLNFGAIISLWLSDRFNLYFVDTVFGTGVAIYIFYNAVHLFLTAAKDLMDEELPKNQRDLIYSIVKNTSEIKSIHNLQTRSAAHKKFIAMEIRIDKSLNLFEADIIVNKLITDIKSKILHSDITIRPIPG